MFEPNLNIEPGTPVLAVYNFNPITKRPFAFLYDFGHYCEYGCIVYIHGCKNLEDSYTFRLNQIKVADEQDFKDFYWGS